MIELGFDLSLYHVVGVILIGLVVGIIDSLFAIGGLFAVPALILIGIPPHTAIAADRFGAIGSCIAMTIKHVKAGTIVWKWVPLLLLITSLGGYFGTKLIISISEEVLEYVVAACVLLSIPFLLLNKKMGTEDARASKPLMLRAFGMLCFILVALYSGIVGMGSGILLILIFSSCMGFTLLQTLGTNVIPYLILNTLSFILFLNADHMHWGLGVLMLASMSIGSYLGTSFALKAGNKRLKKYLLIACAGLAIALFLK